MFSFFGYDDTGRGYLSAQLMGAPAVSEKFDYSWQYGYENDGKNYEGKVPLHHGNVAEIIAGKNEDADPGYAGGDIIK